VLPIEGDLDALWDALGQLAEATGKPMKDVLGLSPLDMIEMALQDMVRAEILKVKGHALEAGETGILEPVGDAILRVHRERRAVVPAV
jgi:hypothetical protein